MKNKSFYPWLVVGLLWGVALLNYMDRQMLSTMQGAMKMDILELQKAEAFGALMAVFLWIYGILSPIAGIIADKCSRKWLIIGSLFVWSAVTSLMGYANDFTTLYWLRAIMGVSEALYIPSALSLIADWHTDKTRSLAIGIHMTGLYTGQAIGGFGATFASMFSWQSAFHWFGLIGIVYAVILLILLQENPKRYQTVPQPQSTNKFKSLFGGVGVILTNWAFWIILFCFAVPSLPGWATKNWLPTLFAENLDIPMSDAGPISTITIAFSSFVGVLIGGSLSDHWVLRNPRGRIYTSAIGLGLTIPSLLLLGLGNHFIGIIGAGLFFGIGYGMFDANNMPILCQFISSKHRATAYGIMNMVGVFAGAAVTHLMGKWSDGGHLGTAFAFLSAIVCIALLLELCCLHPQKKMNEI